MEDCGAISGFRPLARPAEWYIDVVPAEPREDVPMRPVVRRLLTLLILCVSPWAAAPRVAYAAAPALPARLPFRGLVGAVAEPGVVLVNVRSAPRLGASLLGKQAAGTLVTVYGAASGDAAVAGNPLWYKVSAPGRPPRFIYSRYVAGDVPTAPPTGGKLILVSLHDQWLAAYQDGRQVLDTPVTTGRPALPTPTGSFRVLARYTPYQFISPWPKGSRYYYPPSKTRYALLFRAGGYFIHDTPWRTLYGPGTNLPHADPGDPTGSHGCVNVPGAAAKALYAWATLGTAVRIVP